MSFSAKNQFLEYLRTSETYKNLKPYIEQVTQKQQAVYLPILEAINDAIKLKNPVQTLMSIRLAKDCIETKNIEFIELFQKQCLHNFEIIAEFKKEDQQDDRGKLLFSSTPDKTQQNYGNSTFRLVLESIQVWAQIYPFNSDQVTQSGFYETYARLKQKKVKFPSYSYYKMDDVKKNLNPRFVEPSLNSSILAQEQQIKNQPQPSLSVQQVINNFNLQKQLITQDVQRMDNSQQSQQMIKEWRSKLQNLKIQIDKKLDELLCQENDASSMELLNAQDEINQILADTIQYLDGKINFNQYKAKFQSPNQAQNQKNGKLYSIREESETSYYSKFPEVDNAKVNQDSLGLNYNMEKVMKDFQKQLNELRAQNQQELEIQEKIHQTQINDYKKQISDLQQKLNNLPDKKGQQISLDQLQQMNQQHAKELEQKDQQYKAEITNLRQKNAELLNLNTIQENEISQLKKVDQQKKELEKQNAELLKQINSIASPQKLSDEIKRENQQLKDQLRNYEANKKEFEQQKQLLNVLKQENQELKDQIQNLMKERNQLKIQLEKSEQNKQQIQLQNQSQFDENLNNQDGYSENQKKLYKKRIDELLLEIKQKEDKIQDLEKISKTDKQKLHELEQQNFQLQCKTKVIEKADSEEINQLRESIIYTSEQYTLEKKLLQDKIAMLEKQNLETAAQINNLKKEIKSKPENKQYIQNCKDCDNYQIEIENKDKQIFQLNLQIKQLKERLNNAIIQKPEQPISPIIVVPQNEPYRGYLHFPKNRLDLEPQKIFIQTFPNLIPIDQTIIYPYTTPQQYYENAKKNRKLIGIKVMNKQTYFLNSLSQENLLNYKIYHSKNQEVLKFNDFNFLKVGVKQSYRKFDGYIYINYGIYLQTEMQSQSVSFNLSNMADFTNFWTSNQQYHETVERNQQSLIEISVQLSDRPKVICPILELNYNNKVQTLYLPNIIFGLIKFGRINKQNLENDLLQLKVYRSDEFKFEQKVIQDYKDISKLSENIQITNIDNINSYLQQVSELKFAAKFALDFFDLKGIFQIELIPDSKMIIYVGIKESNRSSEVVQLINSLQMMYEENQK